MKTLDFIKTLLHISKTTEPINNKSDYTRVKKWVKRATKLYVAFTIIAIIITVLFSNASSMLLDEFSTMDELSEGIAILAKIVMLFVSLLTAWGFATMILNFKLMIKSMWSSGLAGYRVGEQIQTNHVSVRHEYGSTYKVTTNTENEGCIVAMIYGFINLFVWAFLCVYVCPFLTFRKIGDSKRNLKNFKIARM